MAPMLAWAKVPQVAPGPCAAAVGLGARDLLKGPLPAHDLPPEILDHRQRLEIDSRGLGWAYSD